MTSAARADAQDLQREAVIGGYEAAAEASDRIADFYQAAAALIGADEAEVERFVRAVSGAM